MSDIVERLRALEAWIRQPTGEPYNMNNDLFDDAADEITRLRAENERLRAANDTWASAYHAEYYANERLRIELLTIAGHPELYGTKAPDIARAALAAQPAPSEWRPINIHPVPRDGSRFAICRAGDPDSIECGRYDPLISFEYEPADGGFYKKTERVGYEWSGLNNMERATHWLPLPPAPGKEGKHD